MADVELIIIDEISMVRVDTIDCVDRILRVFSGNMRLPFGGKQLLFVGDVFQLEPVVPSDQKEILSRFYHVNSIVRTCDFAKTVKHSDLIIYQHYGEPVCSVKKP